MARAGLGSEWDCLYSNDIDSKKGASYVANWGGADFRLGDIADVTASQLSGQADLLWASFPCQDLSLAGSGTGLRGDKSSTVSNVWRLIRELTLLQRRPKVIAFENVCGLITSRQGNDFRALTRSFDQAGYWVGAFVVDAKHFVPQSRKRVFFIGVDKALNVDPALVSTKQNSKHSPKSLQDAVDRLPKHLQDKWLWWNFGAPSERSIFLNDILERDSEVQWDEPNRTQKLLRQMSKTNLTKVNDAIKKNVRVIGTIFRRTRIEDGIRVVRAEVRFDGIAGCLRTPNGGSSKQTLIIIEKDHIKTRHLTGRECVRLMGLPENYKIPENTNSALYLAGDGVVVPVVRHISENLIQPLLDYNRDSASENQVSSCHLVRTYAA